MIEGNHRFAVLTADFIGNLPQLAGLHEIRHLVEDGLGGGGIGDLVDLNEVTFLEITPFCPELKAAAAALVDLPGGGIVKQQFSAGGEIRAGQSRENVMLRIVHQGDGGIADLL